MTTNTIKSARKKKMFSWVLLLIMCLGILSGGYLLYQRIQLENQEKHIENIVNYEAVMRYNTYEKQGSDTIYEKLKDSGVTALAIYDTTLQKLADRGEVAIFKGEAAQGLTFYDARAVALPGKTYVLPIPGKYNYFQETWQALNHRLGQQNVVVRQSNRGVALELSPPYQSLVDMNLAISRLQAEDIIAHGFNVIVRPTNFKGETKDDVDFILQRLKGLPRITGIVFVGKEVLGYPHDVTYTVERFNELHIPIIGIEATTQLQYEPQQGFWEMAKEENYQVGRLYTIPKDYLKKLTPSAVSQMFYISDLERNVRFNLLPIFEQGKDNKTALDTSLGYMKVLKEKLEERGYVLGKGSIYPEYSPSLFPMLVTMAGAVALFIVTLQWFYPMTQRTQLFYFLALLFVTYIGYALIPNPWVRLILGLGSAVLAPVNAMIVCTECWKRRRGSHREYGSLRILGEAIVYCVAAALMASIGGIYIASLLGSTDFFMEFSIFRGVKFTFILPVILTVIAYLQRFPLWQDKTINSWHDGKVFIKSILEANVKVYTLIGFVAFLIIAWVFVGRSGHTEGVPVPQFEIAMRHFLENTLFARPREKEFLIGYPAMIFAVYALFKRWPLGWHFLFTLGAVIGLGSMVETFAHIRTPVWMSIVRGFNGLWSGLVVGIICLLIFSVLQYLYKHWNGKGENSHE